MTEASRELIGLLMLSLVPLFGLLAFWATRRQRHIQETRIGMRPTTLTSTVIQAKTRSGFYVATTFEAEPLKRVWAYGLGARGRSEIAIDANGVHIDRVGEPALLIELKNIRRIGTESASIDRGTEAGGLVQIFWQLGETNLISTLRFPSLDDHRTFLTEAKEQMSGSAN